MEMAIVMAMIGVIVTIATPGVERFVIRAREAVLRQDLHVMREALDAYFADHRKYPERLEDLVEKRYIRKLPVDPFTRKDDTWVLVNSDEGGIFDIHSGSDLVGLDGEPYNAW